MKFEDVQLDNNNLLSFIFKFTWEDSPFPVLFSVQPGEGGEVQEEEEEEEVFRNMKRICHRLLTNCDLWKRIHFRS